MRLFLAASLIVASSAGLALAQSTPKQVEIMLDQPAMADRIPLLMLEYCITAYNEKEQCSAQSFSKSVKAGGKQYPFGALTTRVTWDSPSPGVCRARYTGPLADVIRSDPGRLARPISGGALCENNGAMLVCRDPTPPRFQCEDLDDGQRAEFGVRLVRSQTSNTSGVDLIVTPDKFYFKAK